ncbi:hypothetical protein CK220_30905 [Mesorhizobium sp. WSM3860]|nr:hypothetical protein CK220_30905 [Mesorhizobium sp. WSM3860]
MDCGARSSYGPIFAAIVLTFASESMARIDNFAEGRFMLIAAAMVVVLRFFPRAWPLPFQKA